MKADAPSYRGYRFPPEIISHAVWLYHRFCLSLRDVEDLLAKRGILVSHETIRQWCRKFGPACARRLTRRRGRLGDTWHLDELFVTIRGRRQYLWRAVDQDGDTIDILLQPRRDRHAAERSATPSIVDTRQLSLRSRHASERLSQPAGNAFRYGARDRPTRIPWPALRVQFGSSYSRARAFREALLRHATTVVILYPQARLEAREDVLILRPSSPHVQPKTG